MEALLVLAGVVITAVLSFLGGRYSAKTTRQSAVETNETKRVELDQGYVKWACERAVAKNEQEAKIGIAALRGLKDGKQLNFQDRIVVESVLYELSLPALEQLGDDPTGCVAPPLAPGDAEGPSQG